MKRATIREFRSNLAELIESADPIVVTRHGKPKAIVYPLSDVRRVPPELRREIADAAAREFAVDDDPVIECYKRDVDITLILENLRRNPEERIRSLQAMQRLHDEVRK
jgi:prevent-host-death family protein